MIYGPIQSTLEEHAVSIATYGGKTNNEHMTAWFLLLALAASLAHGSWDPAIELSNGSMAYSTTTARLAISGHSLHCIWSDGVFDPGGIVYRRSIDDGSTWGAIIQISGSRVNSNDQHADIACGLAGTIIIAYDSSNNLIVRRSSDSGASWGASTTLGLTSEPSLTGTPNGYLYVADIGATESLRIRQSTDGGASWSLPLAITRNVRDWYHAWVTCSPPYLCYAFLADCQQLTIVQTSNNGSSWQTVSVESTGIGFALEAAGDERGLVHIAWNGDRSGSQEVYYLRSSNNGTTWDSVVRLTVSTQSLLDWIAARPDTILVTYWLSNTSCKRSFDGGIAWENEFTWPGWPRSLGSFDASGQLHTVVSVYAGANYGLCYCRSRDAGSTWRDSMIDVRSLGPLEVTPVLLATSNGNVHVLWEDRASGNWELVYRRGVGLADVEDSNFRADLAGSLAATMMGRTVNLPGGHHATLYDNLGRAVLRLRPGASDVGTLAPGLYFMRTPDGALAKLVLLRR